MTPVIFILLATLFLAYSNGANDNAKGVATLFGSGTMNYKRAITLATIATFAGSLCSIFLASGLLKSFSGAGLVPDEIAHSGDFALAVALGAGATVMLATLLAFPISTTHSLTGALVGAGFMAVGRAVDFTHLWKSFFLPLLVSPLLAIAIAGVLYLLFRRARIASGITKESCVCLRENEHVVPVLQEDSSIALRGTTAPELSLEIGHSCVDNYEGKLLGVNAQWLLDAAHYTSAGFVSFARGLNDTPKIVALLLGAEALGLHASGIAIALAIAAGGLINARKIADVMGKKITPLNHGQGFTANLVTAFLVGFASRWGLPVSTTHVSVGSLFGIGLVTKKANRRVITQILLSWVMTLPIAAILGATAYWVAHTRLNFP